MIEAHQQQAMVDMGFIGFKKRLMTMQAAQYHGHGIKQRKAEENNRDNDQRGGCSLEEGMHGDTREREANEHAASVSEENPCRREIIGQKAKTGSRQTQGKEGNNDVASKDIDECQIKRDAGGHARD